jgi:capsular polysaccharide biosynthesis protein
MVKLALQAGGLLAGVLLGLTLAIAAEARRGRIIQPWQVERGLGLPILAVVPGAARSALEELKA